MRECFKSIQASKILGEKELLKLLSLAKEENKVIVMTTGCFDLLHIGHLRCLEKAKGFGDLLVVGLASDEMVRQMKGIERPIILQEERAELLAGLECVDFVVIDVDSYQLIQRIRPDIYVKGGGHYPSLDRQVVKLYGGTYKLCSYVPSKSTSVIIEMILAKYN